MSGVGCPVQGTIARDLIPAAFVNVTDIWKTEDGREETGVWCRMSGQGTISIPAGYNTYPNHPVRYFQGVRKVVEAKDQPAKAQRPKKVPPIFFCKHNI